MKHIFYFAFLLFIISCKKDRPKSELEKLPPETHVGAKTFGCLVNGQAFKPGGAQLSGGSYQCNFQYLGTGTNGGYYFGVAGRYQNHYNGLGGSGVSIFVDSFKIYEGARFSLKARNTRGQANGGYSSYTNAYNSYQTFDTDGNLHTGELWIKYLDTINQIVSGTFWFDAVSDSGKVVNVREGRFDMRYTR
jgi:hypothetical protein